MRARSNKGAATIEHIGLVVLIALLLMGAIAALVAAPPTEEARRLGSQLDRRIRCPARLPDPCWRDPLTSAYGRPVAGLVRALAPSPAARSGPSGAPLVPVDFRVCRQESCATSTGSTRLTASNRRITGFTAVRDRRAAGAGLVVTYWLYRPALGWERIERRGDAAD